MLADSECDRLATELLHARDNGIVATLDLQNEAGLDLDSGYRIGRMLHDRLVARKFRAIGRKIGFTNPGMWAEFNVSQPIWAHMYEQTVQLADGGKARLDLDGMVAPRIEAEVVLKLRRTLPAGDPSVHEVAACLEWAAVGFEIVDSHYPNWRITAIDAVADFGVHAALVVGTPWQLQACDPVEVLAIVQSLKVSLSCDGKVISEGEGRNALGSPLHALAFLHRVLASQSWPPPLAAGEIITTGSLASVPYVHKGELWRAEITGAPLAALELSI